MKTIKNILLLTMLISSLLLTGCTQEAPPDESEDGTHEMSIGTLHLQITDKPGDLDILYANVTISSIYVHKADADETDKPEEPLYENIDDYDDEFIAEAYGPYTGEKDIEIQFYGNATGGNKPYNWTWDLGDGTISYDQNATHTYSANGTYTINLTVTDEDGAGIKDWYVTIATIGNDDEDSDAGWYLFKDEAQTFDLITLQNVTDILGENDLEAGKYTQIRLTVDSASITINNSNQIEEFDLKIPSNKVKLIKAFWIYEDETTTLILDFDIYESIHETGKNKYIMRPTIKVIEE